MKKLLFLFVLTLFVNIGINAQNRAETDQIIEKFFTTLKEKSSFEAMDNIMALNEGKLISERIMENLKLRFNTLASGAGTYKGFEIIDIEEFAKCLLKYNTVAKYSDMPIFLSFKFYNPDNRWLLLDLNISAGAGSAKSNNNGSNKRK